MSSPCLFLSDSPCYSFFMNTSDVCNKIKSTFLSILMQKISFKIIYIALLILMLLGPSTIAYAHNVGFLTMGIRLHETVEPEDKEKKGAQEAEAVDEKSKPEAYMPTAGIAEVEHTAIADYGTLDVAIWFPTTKMPQTITIGRWQIEAARNAKPSEGSFPLVIISHDSGESRLSHHGLAKFLAANGFVVAALTHPHDSNTDTSAMYTLQQMVHRPQHVTRLVDTLLEDPNISPMIDQRHIAFIGFGTGATTGLMLGGAIPNPAPWPEYCAKALPTDVYCGTWAKQRLDTMALALADALAIPVTEPEAAKSTKKNIEAQASPIYPKMPPLEDARIQSFTLIMPAYGMFFPASALNKVTAPILLVQAEYDSINQKPYHAEALRTALPINPEFFHLKEAGHFSLRDMPSLVPRHGIMTKPDDEDNTKRLEPTLSPEEKSATQEYVQKRILNFLQNTLRL